MAFFFTWSNTLATDPKKLFDNLVAGDAISMPGMKSEFLVLKTRGNSGEWKHFGQICNCGNHVQGIPRLFRWSVDMPVDADGNIFDIWHDPQVTKEARVDLAKKFEGLVVNDDGPSDGEMNRIFKENPDFLKAVELAHYSGAKLGVTVVAMIRTLGGTLSNEQASLLAATVETYAKVSSSVHMHSMSALLGALSGVKRQS